MKPDILETIGDWFGRISNIGESVMNAVSLYKTFNSKNGSKLVKDSFNSGNFLANVAVSIYENIQYPRKLDVIVGKHGIMGINMRVMEATSKRTYLMLVNDYMIASCTH